MSLYNFSDELLISILTYLECPDFLSLFLTNKPFYKKSLDSSFLSVLMKQHPLLDISHLSILPNNILPFFNKVYKRVSFAISQPLKQETNWIPLDSSSTDKNQTIYQTFPGAKAFWSSLPQANEHQDQWLLFDLGEQYEKSVLLEIKIIYKHFSYANQGNLVQAPTFYPSESVQIEMGFHPNHPTWTKSVQVDVSLQGEEKIIIVPIFPQVIFARFVRIRFQGLVSRHTMKNNMFYVCVDKVEPRIIYCGGVDLNILDGVLHNSYNKNNENNILQQEESKTQEIEENQVDLASTPYIKDVSIYNHKILQYLEANLKEKEQKNVLEEILLQNPQLKNDKRFFDYLIRNTWIADLYLDHLFEKQMHLNLLEMVLVLQLSIDWEKMNPFLDNNFLKSEKYLTMFWLYYFDEEKFKNYIANVFEQGAETAFDLLQVEEIEDVKNITSHEPLNLKKILLWHALQKFSTIPAKKPQ